MKTGLSFAAILVAGIGCAQEQDSTSLTLIQTIPLEGVQGRIDHMGIDAGLNHLYMAALGNNTLEVIDLAAGKRIATVEDIEEPQGVAVIPETQTIVVANGADGTCRVFDPALKQTGVLGNLDDADNVRYDRETKRVFVGYGNGALAMIDPDGPKLMRVTKLKGHPESFQLDQSGGRIYVNVPGAREVAVVDKQTGDVLSEWPIQEAQANFPMALDEESRRLYVGCRRPAILIVLDADSGERITTVKTCGDADDVFIDKARKRIYVSGGEGCVSVIDCIDAGHYALNGRVPTASGARTSYFDPDSSRLYVAAPRRGSRPAEIQIFSAQPN